MSGCDFPSVTRADVEGLELLEGAQEVCEALHGPFPRHDALDVDTQGMLARAQAASLVKVMGALERLGARRRAPEGATEAPGGGRAAEGWNGPTRWRVLHDGRWVGIHTDRDAAFAQAKSWRQLYGVAMRVVRTTTVSRRWRVGDMRCYVKRICIVGGWQWGVCDSDAGWRPTYNQAVEAAERCARGQMVRGRR